MELSLETPAPPRAEIPHLRGPRRAHWWFQQMRQIVGHALDRKPAPPPRPEQIYFSLPRRPVACESILEKSGLN